jgi:outer membrane lipoprotein SlyB
VVKKLAGAVAGTASWCTNVGNEHGQVLNSVLTAIEGGFLQPMINGIVKRYETAGKF